MKKKIRVKEICSLLEDFAPLAWQEPYDNSGLLVGNKEEQVQGVLLCIDVTEKVVEEAISLDCNMIVSHHPLIFSPIKSITDRNYTERCLLLAIQNNIAIYAAHTNMDNAPQGVNFRMAQKLGLEQCRVLSPKRHLLQKLVTFVPTANAEPLRNALFNSGAGLIGNYGECSYNSEGNGTFRASPECHPFTGNIGERHTEPEIRIEVILPSYKRDDVVNALLQTHPYEEPAYDLFPLENLWSQVGSGIIGMLPSAVEETAFLEFAKKTFSTACVKHSDLTGRKVKKIALCGGSGSEFITDALHAEADVYLTADLKYHDYFIPENKMLIADIGHFESEQYTKEIFFEQLIKKMSKFAIYFSQVKTNKINYL